MAGMSGCRSLTRSKVATGLDSGRRFSVESPDLEGGRGCVVEDLVLGGHPREAPLASGSVPRSRLSSRLDDADVRDRVVWAVVPAEDELRDLHVTALDGQLYLLDVL